MSGRALAHPGERLALDIVFAIDASASTSVASGADVDGDGSVGRHVNLLLVGVNTDGEDSVLAAEVAAVNTLLGQLDPEITRVGVLAFAEGAEVEVALTDDYAEVRRALAEILDGGSVGGTDLRAAILRGAVELLGTKSAISTRRHGVQRLLLLLTDGKPTLPHFRLFRGPNETANVRAAVEAAGRVGQGSIRIHTFAVGEEAINSPAPRLIAKRTGGRYTPVSDPADLPSLFQQLSFSDIEELRIRNLTTGGVAAAVDRYPDGRFAALVPTAPGENRIEIHARSALGSERRQILRILVDPEAPPPTPVSTLDFMRDHLLRRATPAAGGRELELDLERAH